MLCRCLSGSAARACRPEPNGGRGDRDSAQRPRGLKPPPPPPPPRACVVSSVRRAAPPPRPSLYLYFYHSGRDVGAGDLGRKQGGERERPWLVPPPRARSWMGIGRVRRPPEESGAAARRRAAGITVSVRLAGRRRGTSSQTLVVFPFLGRVSRRRREDVARGGGVSRRRVSGRVSMATRCVVLGARDRARSRS